MNCELLNCTYVFVYSPKNKLTTWNPKTSLLNVCISCIHLLPPKKKANIGNCKRTKITPYNEKKRKFISIIWIYTPVQVANWKGFYTEPKNVPTMSSWWWRVTSFHGILASMGLRCQLWSHRGGRFMGWEWTVLGGRGSRAFRNISYGETRGEKMFQEFSGMSLLFFLFKNNGHDEESYMIFAWIVVEDVGFMKISLHSGSLWVLSNCSFLTLTLGGWLVVLEGFSFTRLTMIWFCLILPRQ